MKKLFEAALEQLRWQWEHATNREEPNGLTCAARKTAGVPEPDILVIYAWGDGARDLYRIMEANGLAENAANSKRFPAKPDPN